MPIFRWGQPWDPFQDLEREVDRLLQGVNLTLHGVRFSRRFPQVNLFELDDSYVLTAEIPGIDISQLDVTIASIASRLRAHAYHRQKLEKMPFAVRKDFTDHGNGRFNSRIASMKMACVPITTRVFCG